MSTYKVIKKQKQKQKQALTSSQEPLVSLPNHTSLFLFKVTTILYLMLVISFAL